MSEQIRNQFSTPYDVHKNKAVRVTVNVMNAMQSAIGVYFNTQLIRHAEDHTGSITFENLGLGSKWEGHSLVVALKVTDINPNSDRIVVEIQIEGGAAPQKEILYKIPSINKEVVPFVGIFTII